MFYFNRYILFFCNGRTIFCVFTEMQAVRLAGGLDRCSGKVEIHRNGSWGTVCDNCWNKEMASTVCSMLQCGSEPLKFIQFDPPLSHNNGTQYYYMCPNKPQSLWQCAEYYNKPHLCQTSKASGIICNGEWHVFFTLVTDSNNEVCLVTWTNTISHLHAQYITTVLLNKCPINYFIQIKSLWTLIAPVLNLLQSLVFLYIIINIYCMVFSDS